MTHRTIWHAPGGRPDDMQRATSGAKSHLSEDVGTLGSYTQTSIPTLPAGEASLGRFRTKDRVLAEGKHLSLSRHPYRVRGVTYGSFAPRLDGELFPERTVIKKDFAAMEAAGLNTVRTYSLPSSDVLEIAAEMNLRLLVGLHYEDWRYETSPSRAARRRVVDRGRAALEAAMDRCAGHPEVMAISVGNEVPADVARVHGVKAVEEGLAELVSEVHAADIEMLATYCNFPTTEFLDVEGQDLICFNVFLEDPRAFERYLRRLQIISGDLPLLLTETGLASRVHGDEGQAAALEWQLRTIDETACAGATVFSWTDEWAVDGKAVEGWGFGITDLDRDPKPSLAVVKKWAGSQLADLRKEWPRISVVVCAYNAGDLLESCLTSLRETHYPDLEVIVCDDGSTDNTLEIARRFPFRVLELERGGLSTARNAGISAASGGIVAFLDSDAMCHPEWPYHLALSLEEDVVATGGPNLPVPTAGLVERAVAASPGGPMHVLISDDRAEHVPGCNMAFQREELLEIDGFDPAYTAAGDDVDVCWKLLDRGYRIGFAPGAQVMHHRRDTVGGYLRQQRGYGKAEKLLSGPHRHRFNKLGQARWMGFIYGGPRFLGSLLRPVIYHGYLGLAPYQGVVRRRSEAVRDWAGALLPLAVPTFVAGLALTPWSLVWLLLSALAMLLVLGYGVGIAFGAQPSRLEPRPIAFRLLVAWMHITQPVVRAWGRLRNRSAKLPHVTLANSDQWDGDRLSWLRHLERALSLKGADVRVAEPDEHWDLEVHGKFFSWRITTGVIWNWTPLSRIRLQSRVWLLAPGGLAALLMAMGQWAGSVLGLVLIVAGAGEAIVLYRRIRSSLRRTTEGSEV